MVAVAGTHGKTTTTSMIIWAALKLNLPISYIVGTTLGFAPSGVYHDGDKYFIYEADEYDRNFLKYHPWLAVITTVRYDHSDIYPTRENYVEAFEQFKRQSEMVIERSDIPSKMFKLAGEARRYDAALASEAVKKMMPEVDETRIVEIMSEFPGVGRRFEKLVDGLYTDYGHHPEEIYATIEVAEEQVRMDGKKGVVVVYQPHQNVRQYEVRNEYRDAFSKADKVLWLPTYLVREDPNLPILTPEELIVGIKDAEVAELNDDLFSKILNLRDEGYLVLLMTAGPADGWLRKKIL